MVFTSCVDNPSNTVDDKLCYITSERRQQSHPASGCFAGQTQGLAENNFNIFSH